MINCKLKGPEMFAAYLALNHYRFGLKLGRGLQKQHCTLNILAADSSDIVEKTLHIEHTGRGHYRHGGNNTAH